MTPDGKLHITLQLDAHRIEFSIAPQSEIFYRNAGNDLNQRYKYFQTKYPNQSAENIWVFVALEQALRFQMEKQSNALEPIDQQLKELNQLIEEQI